MNNEGERLLTPEEVAERLHPSHGTRMAALRQAARDAPGDKGRRVAAKPTSTTTYATRRGHRRAGPGPAKTPARDSSATARGRYI